MSQDLHFYKIKILNFNEEVAQKFEHSGIRDAIIALVAKKDLEGDEKLKEDLFEEIEISFEISGNDKKLEKALNKVNFIQNSRYFIIEDEIFKILEGIIQYQIQESKDQKNDSVSKSLENEYSKLKDIFYKKLLVANLF